MNLLVTGVTRTGNLGGAAMLCAVEDVLGGHFDDVALASILPRQDRAQDGPDHTRIVSADYRFLLLVVAPLCVALWPVRGWQPLRTLLSKLPLFRDVYGCDTVADISGIAFVDGRGLALLYYNAAVVLPALFFSKPVHKLSQSVGPFETFMNARVARWILGHCASVAARGLASFCHLQKLGIASVVYRSDVSFALDIPTEARVIGASEIRRHVSGDHDAPLVICSPSAVVRAHCAAAGVNMVAIFAEVLASLKASGMRVALLPHSADTGIRKNDDRTVSFEIQIAAQARGVDLPVLDPRGDPRLARAMIGCSSVFLASRFHSMVAALSQAVPVVTVGWSHKYAEAAAPFGMEGFTVNYADLRSDTLFAKIGDALANRAELTVTMRAAADEARRSATEGIRSILARGMM